MPHRDSVPMSWRMAKHRYDIVGTRCKNCRNLHFPARKVCQRCGADGSDVFGFDSVGEVLSYTIIHTAPDGFEKQTPYTVGLIKLKEGPTISAHIIGDLSGLTIGKRVRRVFRKLYEGSKSGVINYSFKFELEDE